MVLAFVQPSGLTVKDSNVPICVMIPARSAAEAVEITNQYCNLRGSASAELVIYSAEFLGLTLN